MTTWLFSYYAKPDDKSPSRLIVAVGHNANEAEQKILRTFSDITTLKDGTELPFFAFKDGNEVEVLADRTLGS